MSGFSPSGTGIGKSLGSQPGVSQFSSSSSSPSSFTGSSSVGNGGGGGTGVLEGFEGEICGGGTGVLAGGSVSSATGGKTGRRTVTFGMTVAGGWPSGNVIRLGGPMTGIGIILSPGFCTVTCENDITSVVIGGNVMVRSLVVIGSGVIVVDSVNVIGGNSTMHGGLHVTTGDDVFHISGTAIVEMLRLVVRLVLKVELGSASNEVEVGETDRTEDRSAVDEDDRVPPLVSMTAVPVLTFELVIKLSIAELVRLELLDASEVAIIMAGVVVVVVFAVCEVTFPKAVALAISVDVVMANGIEVASAADVKFAGIEAIVLFNEMAGDAIIVVGVILSLLSNTRFDEIRIPELMSAVSEAFVMEDVMLDAKEAVLFDNVVVQTGMPVSIGSEAEEFGAVRLPKDIGDPVEKELMPIDVKFFEPVNTSEDEIVATDEIAGESAIVLLLSCGTSVDDRPDVEVSARASELFSLGTLELCRTVSIEGTTVDVVPILGPDT
jgi:hypothetical protein